RRQPCPLSSLGRLHASLPHSTEPKAPYAFPYIVAHNRIIRNQVTPTVIQVTIMQTSYRNRHTRISNTSRNVHNPTRFMLSPTTLAYTMPGEQVFLKRYNASRLPLPPSCIRRCIQGDHRRKPPRIACCHTAQYA